MDKPFSADNSPFLTPYSPPGSAAPGIKPFTAVDLAPPLGQNGPRVNAPPQVSPFLEKAPEKAFPSLAAAAPAPVPAPGPAGFPFASKSVAEPVGMPPPLVPGLIGAEPALFGSPSVTSARPQVPLAPVAPPAPAPVPVEAWVPAPMAAPVAAPAPIPAPAPMPAGSQADIAALRASATLRRGTGTEAYAKSALTMTDADAPSEAPSLLMTTGPNFEGRRILSYLGVVSVEIVIPKDVLFRNPAPYGDLHRIKAAEDHLQQIKKKAFEELAAKARALGANAVAGATLQFVQFDAIVFLCAALGTAVKIE
jgi:uncharacterized protein YbjQ (UPF0145 family)